ncbi:13846_t:CDS:2, partial [Entrophospora sp. SA101]
QRAQILHDKAIVTVELSYAPFSTSATQICINAATLALIDAGIPMSDYVCACSAGCIEDEAILDLNNIEESCNTPELSVALLPKSGKVALLQMESHLHVDKFELVMEQAAIGCKDVYNALNQEVIVNMKELINKMSI